MKPLIGPMLLVTCISTNPWSFIQETIDHLPCNGPKVEHINFPIEIRNWENQPNEPGYWWVKATGWRSHEWIKETWLSEARVENNVLIVDTPWGTWYPVDEWKLKFNTVSCTKVVECNPFQ